MRESDYATGKGEEQTGERIVLMRRPHFSAGSVVCEAARMSQLELASSQGGNRTLA
jgi:hypothetical protein